MAICSIAIVILSGIAFFSWQSGCDLSHFYPCSSSCLCTYPWFMSGTFINCSNRGLVTFPRDIPSNAVELDLSCNSLLFVPSLKTLQKLRKLDLTRNKVGDHGVESLCGDDNELEELKLTNNQITKFPTALPNSLIRLDLTGNYIASISCTLLAALPPLQTLILSRNKLTVLPRDGFCPEFGDAAPLSKSLLHLDLSRNNIHTIEEGAFKCLTHLEKLNLSGNLFSLLGLRDFQGLTTLRSLDLGRNALIQMAVGTLSSMTSLQYLNLARNQLTSVPRHLPTSLKLLDLSNNAIAVIHEDPNLLQIDRILIAYNPLTCDCRLRWIKNHLVKSLQFSTVGCRCPPEFPTSTNECESAHLIPRCATPTAFIGQLISQVDDSLLICCDSQSPPNLRYVDTLPPRMSHKLTVPYLGTYRNECSCPQMPLQNQKWASVQNFNETTVLVQWKVIPALEKYMLEIQFFIFGYPECKLLKVVNIQDQRLMLTNLKPDSNYFICITPRLCPGGGTPVLLESCFEITTLDRPLFDRIIRALLGNCSCGAKFLGFVIIGMFISGLMLIIGQMTFQLVRTCTI